MAAARKGASKTKGPSKGSGLISLAEHRKKIMKALKVPCFSGSAFDEVERFSTGLPLLDLYLGGGIPISRMTQIWGDSATGKSAIALWLIRTFLMLYPEALVAVVDSEGGMSGEFTRSFGVDMDRLLILDPETVEDAFQAIQDFIELNTPYAEQTGQPVLVIWDSLTATATAAAKKAGYEGKQPGRLAAATSQGWPLLRSHVHRTPTALVVINQGRMDVGRTFGDPMKATGGKATRYYMDLSLRLYHVAKLKAHKDADPYGVRVKATIDKSRVCFPFLSTHMNIYYTAGVISDTAEVYDALKRYNLASADAAGVKLKWEGKDAPTHGTKDEFAQKIAMDLAFREEVFNELGKALRPKTPSAVDVIVKESE